MAKKPTTISKELPHLLVWLIVETCLERENIIPTHSLVNGMVARANYHFDKHDTFRKGVKGKDNKGRDYLYAFITHWVESRYWEKHEILPKEYIPYQEQIPSYD